MQQILVIDDDTGLCELLTKYLEPDGYTVIGLKVGTDDALAKPLKPLEVVARIKAALLHTQIDPKERREHELLVVGDIEIDHRTRTVRRAGEVVELTLVEYSLLEKLLNACGRILERKRIVKEVLHRDLSPLDRSIDTHLSNLRRKLGHQVNGVQRIKTIRGVGYIYASPEGADSLATKGTKETHKAHRPFLH